jgi:hypothetical protein
VDKGAQTGTQTDIVVFGNLAVMVTRGVTVDPWLCVPAFQQVCLYRTNSLEGANKTSLVIARLANTCEFIYSAAWRS